MTKRWLDRLEKSVTLVIITIIALNDIPTNIIKHEQLANGGLIIKVVLKPAGASLSLDPII